MTTNDAATTPTDETEDPTCPYCGDKFAAARAEIGYPYCMKPACTARGKEDRNSAPIEIDVVQPETRF